MRQLGRHMLVAIFVLLYSLFTTTQIVGANPIGEHHLLTHDKHIELSPLTDIATISVLYENDRAWPRWSYAHNKEVRDMLIDVVALLSSEQSNVRTIVIEGAASPIGSEGYNRNLALRRATILRTIISKMKGGDKLRIYVVSAGEDWETFREYVHERYFEPNREAVLAILDTDLSNDAKERKLQALDRGVTWRVLVNDYMGPARNAAVIHLVESDDLTKPLPFKFGVRPVDLLPLEEEKPVVVEESKPTEVVPPRKPVVALRSNLLVPALNVGVEVPIGTNWSVAADYYFPWVWPKRDNKDCFELLAWGIEGRYWFGRNRNVFDRLQGHSVGLYGYMGYYDFERNFHGHQGEFMNVGVDYTYAMAVGKRKQIHLEFSLGVGYIYSQARKYTVIESHGPLISDKITRQVGFFGPTKANISLVVPIFQKVKPNDKQRGNE